MRCIILIYLLVNTSLFLASCQKDDISPRPFSDSDFDREEVECEQDGDTDLEHDFPDLEKESEPPELEEEASLKLVGEACQNGNECLSRFCLTDTNSDLVMDDYFSIPNGYCSAMYCDILTPTKTCGFDVGGACFSLWLFNGVEEERFLGVCLHPCEKDDDCRQDEGMRCFNTELWVAQGLLSEKEERTNYSALKTCIPAGLLNLFNRFLEERSSVE